MWFRVFVGCDVNEISELSEQHKVQPAEMKFTSESHSSQEQRDRTISLQAPPSHATTPQRKLQQYTASDRVLNDTGAQAHSTHQDVRTRNYPHEQHKVEINPTPHSMNVFTASHLSRHKNRSAASGRVPGGLNDASQ